ncbi:MAG: hypothetical protein NXH95_13600 [Pseudomonadaceae bacterium]|nr:hypothetical protein [Pseudomonadaceae bacterium]
MSFAHYFRDVIRLTHVDVYRVLELFGVTSHAIGHAIKKLLCSGQRGVKDRWVDVTEAIHTLLRWCEMQIEDGGEPEDMLLLIGKIERWCVAQREKTLKRIEANRDQ